MAAAERKGGAHPGGAKDPPKGPRQKRRIPPEEAEEMLRDHVEIAPEHWGLVRRDTHVRYATKADGLRPGGFVAANGAADKAFKLRSGFDPKAPGFAVWTVRHAEVERLFAKPDAVAATVLQGLEAAVAGVNRNVQLLADFAQRLEARLARLEAQQKGGRPPR